MNKLLTRHYILKQRCDWRAQRTVVRNFYHWHAALYLRFESVAWLKEMYS